MRHRLFAATAAACILGALIGALVPNAAAAPAARFTPQVRLGFSTGDQWEPAIAADAFGHVYVLYAQYGGVPGCPTCASPTMILTVSPDRGRTWGAPRLIHPAGATGGQWDPQIAVDPLDGRTVYAAWLQDGKSDIVVGRSDDFGATWSVVVADATNAGTDKDILAVRGSDVFVAYNHAQTMWVSSSHDRGVTWTSTKVEATGKGKLGWALAGGGTVDTSGGAHFGWAGYERNGGAKGAVNLFVSSSSDGGTSWQTSLVDVSGAPPDCSAYLCGWAYLGAQLTVASSGTTLYALWNAGPADEAPERIYLARSVDGGATWSARQDVSLAAPGANHAFLAIAAGGVGDVRVAWMDDRSGGLWNVYYRSSTDGGASWSAEADLSTYVAGFAYIAPDGFGYPFGDYFELDIDDRGTTHAIFGEGLNYDSPGSIWYVSGR